MAYNIGCEPKEEHRLCPKDVGKEAPYQDIFQIA